MSKAIQKLNKLKNPESFMQINTIKGFKYVDRAGEIVNAYHKNNSAPQFQMGLNGLVIEQPKDKIDELKITAQVIWAKFSEIDSLDSISTLFAKESENILKILEVEKIKNELGYDVPVDKSSRRYDFIIDNGKELFIIETNFYGGGGSKLKSTAGGYRNLSDVLNGKYKFFWITDGMGWKTTTKPLRETFNHNDYLFNLTMLEKGILEFLLT